MPIQPFWKNKSKPKLLLSQVNPSQVPALIFNWGSSGNLLNLDLHNIFFFSDNLPWSGVEHISKKETIHLWANGVMSTSTSVCKPEECADRLYELGFYNVNVPNNQGPGLGKLDLQKTRKISSTSSTEFLKTDVDRWSQWRRSWSSVPIEFLRPQVHKAHSTATVSNNKFAAFLRHANFSSSIKKSYFWRGKWSIPGGGIPTFACFQRRLCSEMVELKQLFNLIRFQILIK